jgi:hypothetical protein
MPKAFDATTRDVLERDPVAWLEFLHIDVLDPSRVRVIDTDLSTVTAEADKVLRIEDEPPCVVHLEFQTTRDVRLAERLIRYNVRLSYRHELPVHSVAVLLRPEAAVPGFSEILEKELPRTGGSCDFGTISYGSAKCR